MSEPSVDLEKGITGLKEEEEGKEEGGEEKVVHRYNSLKIMCVKLFMDMCPVLFFLAFTFEAISFYRQGHIWWPALVLYPCAILNCWYWRRKKHAYIQATLASAESDLSTALLASSSKK